MSNAIATPAAPVKTESNLPAILQDAPSSLLTGRTDTGATKEGFSSIPYVGYYGAKAEPQTRAACEDAGVKVGQFFLHHVTPIKVDPFGLHWLTYGRLYTKRDSKMNVISSLLENPKEKFSLGYREHLFAVVAVRLPGPDGVSFVPALIQLHGGLAMCFKKSEELLEIVANPQHCAARGEAFAKASKAVLPGGRFVAKITASQEEGDDGNDWNKGASTVSPTPEADVLRFNSWFAANKKIVYGLIGINDERIKEAKEKLNAPLPTKK